MRDLTFNPKPWMDDAACAHITDRDLFFPNGVGGEYQHQVNEAKALCSTCPVIADCMQYALELHPVEGIWAGTTEAERRQMQHHTRRSTCA